MASVTPDVGRNWYADNSTKSSFTEYIDVVAVGEGTTATSSSDTQLDKEVYRSSKSNSNVTIERTTNTGEVRCEISVTGGTEVPAGTKIYEIGLFSSDGVLLYREVRSSAIQVDSGETQTQEFKVNLMD